MIAGQKETATLGSLWIKKLTRSRSKVFGKKANPEGAEQSQSAPFLRGEHFVANEAVKHKQETAQPSPRSVPVSPLLSFVAISQLDKGDETLQQLVLQCLAFFSTEEFRAGEDVSRVLSDIFGLDVESARIDKCVDLLISCNSIRRTSGDVLAVDPELRERIEWTVQEARDLEHRVRLGWDQLCDTKFKSVSPDAGWECLQEYLFRLFRRHGIQTVALLDNCATKNSEDVSLLTANLSEVLDSRCAECDRSKTENAINEFLANVGTDPERTKYIVQLADGAFNFYSLSAPPEIALQLQNKLNELTLFLDTNFLFGVFGLDDNPLVAVSQELVRIVSDKKLPFRLRYHESTEREMKRTIGAIASAIKSRHWSAELSRAAAASPYISGIERHFHEENAKNSIDPEVFFKPYEHFDLLLKERGIDVYRADQSRTSERADLISRYNNFLQVRGRLKPYEAVDHDMTIYDCVRNLRSKASSSLDAKALIITCDSTLNKFDWQQARISDSLACTVLPNHFLQLLRPYVPASSDFDKSFAETFAIPEFRAISGGYHLATRKLLSLLATYKGLKEETASSLLANTLLLDRFKNSVSQSEGEKLIENAIVSANTQLLEERVAMENELVQTRGIVTKIEAVEEELSKTKAERDGALKESADVKAKTFQHVIALSSEIERLKYREQHVLAGQDLVRKGSDERIVALEQKLAQLEADVVSRKRIFLTLKLITTAATVGLLILGIEWALHYFHVSVILNNSNSYGLRALSYVAIAALTVGLVERKWRAFLWVTVVSAALVALLSLLGGPTHTP